MPPNATPTSAAFGGILVFVHLLDDVGADFLDRKSTRLNSSHVSTSYADFCLKKKSGGSIGCATSKARGLPECKPFCELGLAFLGTYVASLVSPSAGVGPHLVAVPLAISDVRV